MSEKCPVCKRGTLIYTWGHPTAPGCLRLVCVMCGAVLGPDYKPVKVERVQAG